VVVSSADAPPVGNAFRHGTSQVSGFRRFSPGAQSVWGHFRMRSTIHNIWFFSLADNNAQHIGFYLGATGHVLAWFSGITINNGVGNGGGGVYGWGSRVAPISCWFSFAFEVTIADGTGGSINTWINGEPDIGFTGIDTCRGDPLAIVAMFGSAGTGVFGYDDIVLGDTAGGVNTLHVDDVRVDCMKPIANGTDRDFGLSTGPDHYAVLDEAATDIADYAETTVLGARMSVRVAALTNVGGTIVAVQVTAHACKTVVGPCGFKIYLLTNGTRYYSEEFFPSVGSWEYFQKVWDQHPFPSAEAWTEADFNACEFGIERTT
jgi:hypothetical protein